MTVKDKLHKLVDELPSEVTQEALDCLRWLAAEGERLTDQDLARVARGEDEISRGHYVTLADLRQTLRE